MIPKSFSTKRLLISVISVEYDSGIREIVGWLNNPLVVRFSEQRHKRHTIGTQQKYINSFQKSGDYVGIYIASENGGVLIGTIAVAFDEPNGVADVGIMIGDHAKWGMGYGFEAWKGVCDQLFENGCRKVEAGCMACNVSMMSICHRYGMIEEGRRDAHFIYHDIPMDLVYWGRFK